MKVYTRSGDDGTTGLLYGGRARKNDPAPSAYGAVDEAQAAIGLARAVCSILEAPLDGEIAQLLARCGRDLWVVMTELACAPNSRSKLEKGKSKASPDMVASLEATIDLYTARFEFPNEFVVPGDNQLSAALDFARAVVRRAERDSIGVAESDSQSIPFLNRLSDLLWVLARYVDATLSGKSTLSKSL